MVIMIITWVLDSFLTCAVCFHGVLMQSLESALVCSIFALRPILRYFLSRFPQLLMAVYSFAASNCHLEPTLERALPPDLVAFPFHERFMAGQPKELPPQAEEAGVVGGLQAAAPSPALQQWAAAAEQGEGRGALWVRQMGAVLPPVFAGVWVGGRYVLVCVFGCVFGCVLGCVFGCVLGCVLVRLGCVLGCEFLLSVGTHTPFNVHMYSGHTPCTPNTTT